MTVILYWCNNLTTCCMYTLYYACTLVIVIIYLAKYLDITWQP